jgi:PAS domain S-box-containing protein
MNKDFNELIDQVFQYDEIKQYFFDNLPLICMVVNYDGNVVIINKKFLECTGYNLNEVQGSHYSLLLHPDDLEEANKIVEDNVPNKTFLEGIETYTNRYKKKGGGYVKLKWRKEAVYFGDNYYLCLADCLGNE